MNFERDLQSVFILEMKQTFEQNLLEPVIWFARHVEGVAVALLLFGLVLLGVVCVKRDAKIQSKFDF